MSFMYNAGAQGLLDGSIDWSSDTIRCRLVETTETLDEDATAMTGMGVTGNDQTLGSKTGPTKDDSGDRITYGAANPTFTAQAAGDEVNRVIVFQYDTDDASSVPIALVDLSGGGITPNGGDITIAWAGGLVFALNNQP